MGRAQTHARLMTDASEVEVVDVAVIGLGYIGLPTAAVLARAGLDVVGVDRVRERVEAVNRGELPFLEEGLATVLAQQVEAGRLRAQTATPSARTYIIAVPTPSTGRDHVADLSLVEAATRQIVPRLTGGELIVLESTCPPGTTRALAETIGSMRPDLSTDGSGSRPQVYLSYCPERVLPGRIMTEMVTNSRVIGGLTPQAGDLARDLYATFCRGDLVLTDATTAEMTKLTENSFRDLNIAFANELALVCERVGVDVWELVDLANRHPRVSILQPGPGVGGHCIAVDPWFLVSSAPEETRLIRTARQVNDSRPAHYVGRILEAMEPVSSPTVAVLGLTFKADVDDLRQSPALAITEQVAAAAPHARVLVAEPHATELPASLARWDNVRLTGWRQAVEQADVVAVLVAHQEFADLDPHLLEGRSVIDATGLWRARAPQLTG